MTIRAVFSIGASALALMLGACDAGPSAAGKAPPTVTPAGVAGAGQVAAASDPRDAPVPLVGGKPMWAANRKHTAQENATYEFGRNGRDFGAASEADYVAKAHAFANAPPEGVQRIARPNGDQLLYDPKSNTFAVVTKAGAPRTMFKPTAGPAYWRQQLARQKSDNGADSQS